MPAPRSGESKEQYMSRCVRYCVTKEGLSKDQASAKCYGMWGQARKKHNKSMVDEDFPRTETGYIGEI